LPVAVFGHKQRPERVGHNDRPSARLRPLSRQPQPVISCQQLTRSGHLERGAELARVSRPSLALHGQNLPGADRQKIAVLVGYHNGETGVTALDWSTFDV
jgi:hypothetical protein